ncbi:hypothetical protein GKZ90_0019215 [Flavobacterium sp. MC2016-06]|jgi:hypothetical protein|uniref:hypothetical protein n=1 Tax=Flavobacterium sp. MC2016-06 TaxID=2676308 RepID=UPI0012BA8A21|nr:hypothetical protein [Flavobacterium sp. MC2016-06]MBU3861264.1 hypothetical protein [Flavobacterium sp. MC2016-06]
MDILNLKNKIVLLLIIGLVACKRNYTCKEYILSYNYTTLKIENINEKEIQNSFFFIKRNNQTINKGHLEVVEKVSKDKILVKFKFFKEDTIYRTDTLHLYIKNISHYITDTKEVCVESVGTPYIIVCKIDGHEFINGEAFLKN